MINVTKGGGREGGELMNGYKQTADRIGGILELLLQSGRTHTHSLTGTLVIGTRLHVGVKGRVRQASSWGIVAGR